MYSDFHERYLAKVVAMDMLSKLAGFTDRDQPVTLTSEQLEVCPVKRRSVIHSLTEQNFIEARVMGQTGYTITLKAFHECDQEPYIGELNIGTPDSPIATWLSGPMIKQAIADLVGGKSTIKDATNGRGKVVVSSIDARDEDQRFFDRHLSENLGAIACCVTDMSKAFSECLKVPPNSITSDNIGDELLKLHKEQAKEIERLKRTNDALIVFFCEVDELGGWGKFVELAHASRTVYGEPSPGLSPGQRITKAMSKTTNAGPS